MSAWGDTSFPQKNIEITNAVVLKPGNILRSLNFKFDNIVSKYQKQFYNILPFAQSPKFLPLSQETLKKSVQMLYNIIFIILYFMFEICSNHLFVCDIVIFSISSFNASTYINLGYESC